MEEEKLEGGVAMEDGKPARRGGFASAQRERARSHLGLPSAPRTVGEGTSDILPVGAEGSWQPWDTKAGLRDLFLSCE